VKGGISSEGWNIVFWGEFRERGIGEETLVSLMNTLMIVLRKLLRICNNLFLAITYAKREYAYLVHVAGALCAISGVAIGGFSAMR
jgi:hypothetical protein